MEAQEAAGEVLRPLADCCLNKTAYLPSGCVRNRLEGVNLFLAYWPKYLDYGVTTGQVAPVQVIRPWMAGLMGVLAAI
jgi:hypothetical protein